MFVLVLTCRPFVADGEVRLSPTDLHSSNYHIVGVDLRNIDEVALKLQQSEIDFTVPTIFLAECVLVYIESQNCHNLLKWFGSNFKSAVFVNYEQVNMNDRFGEVMLNNLRQRGCSLAGVESCISLDTQISRYLLLVVYRMKSLLEPTLLFQVPELQLARCAGVGHGADLQQHPGA